MTDSVRIAILGGGNIRVSPAVIGSLASYFGERPLELRLYDADEERLDLLDRMARACFILNKAPHDVFSHTEVSEVLTGANRLVLQLDAHCAGLVIGDMEEPEHKAIEKALGILLEGVPSDMETLSLQGRDVHIPLGLYRRLDWPQENEQDVRWMPHQILRWLRGEEPIFELLTEHDKSPLKAWLDDPNSAELVISRTAS